MGNVVRAMELAQPQAVDVSGGVESKPGVKDPELIRKFVQVVRDKDKLKGAE